MPLAAALLAAWCGGEAIAGTEVAAANSPVSTSKGQFSVQPPTGWIYSATGYEVLISRDGPLLNGISFALRKHKNAFPALKKESAPDALPEELAENYVADLKSRPGISDVKVVTVEPAVLAGQPAFKIRATYVLMQEMGGAPYEQVALGTPLKDYLLLASFAAPQIHFFESYLPAFEESVQTLTLAEPGTKP
jgi:hypothetical protein